MSVEEGLKHLLSLSDRKFGKDDIFVLSGFDRLARSKAVARMYTKLKSDTRTAADAVEVTKKEMIALLCYNKGVKKALRSGRICPQIPSNLKQQIGYYGVSKVLLLVHTAQKKNGFK